MSQKKPAKVDSTMEKIRERLNKQLDLNVTVKTKFARNRIDQELGTVLGGVLDESFAEFNSAFKDIIFRAVQETHIDRGNNLLSSEHDNEPQTEIGVTTSNASNKGVILNTQLTSGSENKRSLTSTTVGAQEFPQMKNQSLSGQSNQPQQQQPPKANEQYNKKVAGNLNENGTGKVATMPLVDQSVNYIVDVDEDQLFTDISHILSQPIINDVMETDIFEDYDIEDPTHCQEEVKNQKQLLLAKSQMLTAPAGGGGVKMFNQNVTHSVGLNGNNKIIHYKGANSQFTSVRSESGNGNGEGFLRTLLTKTSTSPATGNGKVATQPQPKLNANNRLFTISSSTSKGNTSNGDTKVAATFQTSNSNHLTSKINLNRTSPISSISNPSLDEEQYNSLYIKEGIICPSANCNFYGKTRDILDVHTKDEHNIPYNCLLKDCGKLFPSK